jgi:RNA polymerase sigma-70 factor (ECF subfamily)
LHRRTIRHFYRSFWNAQAQCSFLFHRKRRGDTSEPGSAGAELEKGNFALILAVRRFAMRFERSTADAVDLIQDTNVKGVANINQFQACTKIKSWPFTIARNTYCTKCQNPQKIHSRCGRGSDHRSSGAVGSGWSLRTTEVTKAIAALDTDKRQALLMATGGDSYEHIASACGCELGTIKGRIARARAAETEALGEPPMQESWRLVDFE